jgi:HPt (histidine-containing phosphotransfer) domain-containing protein
MSEEAKMVHEEKQGTVPPLKHEELIARCLGNLDFAERVLTKFQERFEADLTELEAELVSGNTDRVARLAHRMKGASANTAATGLHTEASCIEELARSDQKEEISLRLGRLRSEWSRFVESAESFRACSGSFA